MCMCVPQAAWFVGGCGSGGSVFIVGPVSMTTKSSNPERELTCELQFHISSLLSSFD